MLACQQPLVVGESQVGPNGVDAADGSSQRRAERCPDAARLRAADNACWPTEHVGLWHGFVTGDARYSVARTGTLLYPSGDVRLYVDSAGSGTLTFLPPTGLAAPGLDAGLDATATDPADAFSPGSGVVESFAYALLDLSMSGGPSDARRLDRWLQFSIALSESEPSASSAATNAPPTCDACGPPTDTLSVSLWLSADGTALRGTISSRGPEGELAAGLELTRE